MHGPWSPDFEFAFKADVKVVDGPFTGHMGWIDAGALDDENTDI